MAAKDMTSSQIKLTNSQKILNYLKENIGEVSNEEISRETGIDKTNIPREIKKLEAQGYKISKRYEQIGRSKFVWFLLTSSQEKKTSSQDKKNIIPIKKREKVESSESINNNQMTKPKENKLNSKQTTEIQLLGMSISLDKIIQIARETLENRRNLTKGMKYYLNSWESRYERYKVDKPENFLIDEFESMKGTLTFLEKIKKINEGLKNATNRT